MTSGHTNTTVCGPNTLGTPFCRSVSLFIGKNIGVCPDPEKVNRVINGISSRSFLQFITSLDVIRKSSSAIKDTQLSKQMTIGWFLTPSIKEALAHSAMALTFSWKTVANGSRLHTISCPLPLIYDPASTPFSFLDPSLNQIIPC